MSRKYKVEDLDLSSRRSIDVEQLDDEHAVVRNFYHDGEFWKARIPLNHVDLIVGQAFNFSGWKRKKSPDGTDVVRDHRGNPKPKFGFINHVQSRFCFADGHAVQLFGNEDETTGPPAKEVSDFVYSIEAVGPPGVDFNFRNGMSGKLMCAHRFLSTQEMVFERIVVLGYYVRESPPLPLTKEEKKTILLKSIHRSDQAGLDEVYYLYRCFGTNNCTSNPFAIIDQSVKYKWWQKLGSLLYRFPINPRLYLRVRGLDSDPSHVGLLRNEYTDFIQNAATKRRKRAVIREEIRKRRAERERSANTN